MTMDLWAMWVKPTPALDQSWDAFNTVYASNRNYNGNLHSK